MFIYLQIKFNGLKTMTIFHMWKEKHLKIMSENYCTKPDQVVTVNIALKCMPINIILIL